MRPDTTGRGKYLTTLLLGMQAALTAGGQADPWNGLKFRYDFPAAKYPVTGYEMWGGSMPNFTHPNDPMLAVGPDNDYNWGLVQTLPAPPGDIVATVTSIVHIAGIPDQLYIFEPNKQIFVVVRGIIAPGVFTAWSEMMGTYTKPLPPVGEYPNIDPPPIHPVDRVVGFVPPLV